MKRLVLAVLVVVVVFGMVAVLFGPGNLAALRASIGERLAGETPEAKAGAYLRAVATGDEAAALAAWQIPDWWPAGDSRREAIDRRRQDVTRQMIAAGTRAGFTVTGVEWWRTCCEPGPATDSRAAGGARMRVQVRDAANRAADYVFDVFVPGSYWGAAEDYPPRTWILRDVYPQGQSPIFWTYAATPDQTSSALVTLGIFSGRPDPSWSLTEAQTTGLLARMEVLPQSPPEAGPARGDNLGYRGFVVGLGTAGGSSRSISAYHGIVEDQQGDRVTRYADASRSIERWLLDTLPAELGSGLRDAVQEAIQP